MIFAEGGHAHVASGLAGYGPDGADGYGTVTDVDALCEAIRAELDGWAESEIQSAHAAGEAGDYETAWKLHLHTLEMDVLRSNLDPARRQAPLYRDDEPAWRETVARIVGENFAFDVDEGRSRVYVWDCPHGTECEHLSDEQ